MFKKIILLSLVGTLAISTLQPKKAEAGVILFAAGAAIGYGHSAHENVLVPTAYTLTIAGLAIVAVAVFNFYPATNFLPLNSYVGLFILDADGGQKQDALANYFAKRYPFIDNLESLTDLSEAVIKKAEGQAPDASGHIMVRLTAEEIQLALQSADISQEDLNIIRTELQ